MDTDGRGRVKEENGENNVQAGTCEGTVDIHQDMGTTTITTPLTHIHPWHKEQSTWGRTHFKKSDNQKAGVTEVGKLGNFLFTSSASPGERCAWEEPLVSYSLGWSRLDNAAMSLWAQAAAFAKVSFGSCKIHVEI